MNEDVAKSIKLAKTMGKEQYNIFIGDRLIDRTVSLYESIKKNNLILFQEKIQVEPPKLRKR